MSGVSGSETEFFNVGNVVVTNTRFMVDGQTYAMNGVTSVKRGYKKPDRGAAMALLVVGILWFFAALNTEGLGGELVGLVIAGIGAFMYKEAKATYSVVLQTSSGEVQALESKDQAYIEGVIAALNNSIIHRG